jgi:hypothetical protein
MGMKRALGWEVLFLLARLAVSEAPEYTMGLNAFISGYSGEGHRLVFDLLEMAKQACNKDRSCSGITREPVSERFIMRYFPIEIDSANHFWGRFVGLMIERRLYSPCRRSLLAL